MPRGTDPIKRVELPSGAIRYRFTVDVGLKVKTDKDGRPVLKDGKPVMVRDQRTHSFERRKDAVEKRASLLADKARGNIVAASKKTLGQFLTEWLAGRRLKRRTLANYRDALKPVHEQLGEIELQKLTKAAVDKLVTRQLTEGRRVNRPGTPLAASTVLLMLTVLTTALDDAMKQGLVLRNVAKLVDRPQVKKKEMKTWTAESGSPV